jgi:hypothetical protein
MMFDGIFLEKKSTDIDEVCEGLLQRVAGKPELWRFGG